jgi:hypothetical protein
MTPVEWEGRFLADGGAFVRLAHLPIQADRIIASDVSSHPDAPRTISSLGRALAAYLQARERPTRPARQVRGRPVTVLRYGALVERLPAFRRPRPSVVRRVITEASHLACETLAASTAEGNGHG